jgi:hypothetical protein
MGARWAGLGAGSRGTARVVVVLVALVAVLAAL